MDIKVRFSDLQKNLAKISPYKLLFFIKTSIVYSFESENMVGSAIDDKGLDLIIGEMSKYEIL